LGIDVIDLEFLIQGETLDLMLRACQERKVGALEGEGVVKISVLQ
jgi:hypothetical protein